MAKMFLLKEFSTEVVEANTLDDYYYYLECNTIDIVQRSVKGRLFDIICDDEGLFKKNNYVSARNKIGEPMLVGNLLFCHHDEEGNMTSITEEEIELLNSSISQTIVCGERNGLFNCINNIDY